jgi:hypothetical protein
MFLTPLPGEPAEQAAVKASVNEALHGLPGPWKAGVARGVPPGSWILSIFRDDGFECTLFLTGPITQNTLLIRDRVADALQLHVLGLPRGGTELPKSKV